MFTVSQRTQIAWCWMLSFLRRPWVINHYPIVVKHQENVPANASWCAYVLKWHAPVGFGTTKQEALSALSQSFDRIAAKRWSDGSPLPRPGTRAPITFAPSSRVNEDPEALQDFALDVFELQPSDPYFISDQSSLEDFGGPERVQVFKDRIRKHYGIALKGEDSTCIADILVKVRSRHGA